MPAHLDIPQKKQKTYNMRFNIILTIIISTFITLLACGTKTNNVVNSDHSNTNINQKEKLSIVQMFKANKDLPMDQRIEQFYKLKRECPTAYDFENEDALNFYGYQLLWNNEVQDAFLIFKMVVSEFPNSSNAYDSYGEIWLKLWDKSQALINYKKSLELNPNNFNAEDQIAYILDPEKKPEPTADKFAKLYDVEAYREDLDQLAKKAEQAYDDLMDLGMNVEVRYSGRIFEVASSMMGNAITAKSNKIEKKLKAIDLQLKKLKIDNDAGVDPNNVINGQGYVITDRNELLKKLSGKA